METTDTLEQPTFVAALERQSETQTGEDAAAVDAARAANRRENRTGRGIAAQAHSTCTVG